MPSGASGPVSGSGAPKRMTSSALAPEADALKAAIANAGYDADDIPANPDAYKLLPKTCKKFEDGGGHPKPKTPVVA